MFHLFKIDQGSEDLQRRVICSLAIPCVLHRFLTLIYIISSLQKICSLRGGLQLLILEGHKLNSRQTEMLKKKTRYHLADGDDVEESALPPSHTPMAQRTYMQVIIGLFLISCIVNVGFTVDKMTQSATRMQPTSKYGK